jgi:transposase InsO family protein
MDNVFIERLWRSLKQGHLPQRLRRLWKGSCRHRGVDGVFNPRRLHQALGGQAPMAV